MVYELYFNIAVVLKNNNLGIELSKTGHNFSFHSRPIISLPILFIAQTGTLRVKGKLLAITMGQQVNTGHMSLFVTDPDFQELEGVLDVHGESMGRGCIKQADTAKH